MVKSYFIERNKFSKSIFIHKLIYTMITYIITHFKVLDHKSNDHFRLFEKMTIPTVVNQTNKNYKWYIYASSVFKTELIKLTERYPQIECIFTEFVFEPKCEEPYCTVRLDNGHGLNPHFLQHLQKYKHHNKAIITYSHGLNFTLKMGEVELHEPVVTDDNKIGLCGIGINIYDYDSPNIIDKTPNMYYLFQ